MTDADRRGIRWMVVAMAAFIANDTLVKLASAALPPAQIIGVRGAFACALIVAAARFSGTPLQPRRLLGNGVGLRAAIDAAATFGYLLSLFQLPLANATAINMATPLLITLMLAAAGQTVGTRRWAATLIGFGGVLLVIQPRLGGFNGWAWLCLGATALHALRDLVTARIPKDIASLSITLATAVSVTVGALGWLLVTGWAPMRTGQVGLLAAAALFLALGYHAVIRATRAAELTLVAPFRYSGLLMALVLGWLVWGDVPNPLAWAGIAAIVATGLYLLRQGARRPRQDAQPGSAPDVAAAGSEPAAASTGATPAAHSRDARSD